MINDIKLKYRSYEKISFTKSLFESISSFIPSFLQFPSLTQNADH